MTRATFVSETTAATFRSGSVGSTTTSASSNVAAAWSSGSRRTCGSPLADSLQGLPELAVLHDEQLREIARKPTRAEVAAVRADALQELLEQPHVASQIVVQALHEVGVVERRPVDRRLDVRRRIQAVARHEVDVVPSKTPFT